MKNKIVKEKKKNYMTEIKDATIELIKPIFKKYGATTPDKAMLKEEVIAEIEDKRKAKYSFSYLKQLGSIKKYKGKFYYSEENENETSANKNMTKSQKISLIIFIILVIIAIGMSVSDKMITNEKYQDSNVSFEIQKSWAKTTSNYSTEWNFYKYINNKPNTNLNSVDSNNEVSEDDYSSYPAGINIYYDTVAEDSGINNIEDIKTKVQQNIQSMEDKAENKADAVNMSITTTSNGYDLLKVRVLYSEKPQEILYYYYILNGDKLACITTYSFNLDDEKTIEEDTNNLVNSFKWF